MRKKIDRIVAKKKLYELEIDPVISFNLVGYLFFIFLVWSHLAVMQADGFHEIYMGIEYESCGACVFFFLHFWFTLHIPSHIISWLLPLLLLLLVPVFSSFCMSRNWLYSDLLIFYVNIMEIQTECFIHRWNAKAEIWIEYFLYFVFVYYFFFSFTYFSSSYGPVFLIFLPFYLFFFLVRPMFVVLQNVIATCKCLYYFIILYGGE